jgi:hypothetical protein
LSDLVPQLRLKDVLAKVESIRPSVRVSLSMRRGLEMLQKSVDDKVLSRLGANLRSSTVMSCAF